MKSLMDKLNHCSEMYPNITLVKPFSTDEITVNGMGKVTPVYNTITVKEIDGVDVSSGPLTLNFNYAHDSIEFCRNIKFIGYSSGNRSYAIVQLAD